MAFKPSCQVVSNVSTLNRVFIGQFVKGWIRVLGACAMSSVRSLCPVEESWLCALLTFLVPWVLVSRVVFSCCVLSLFLRLTLAGLVILLLGPLPLSSGLVAGRLQSAGRARFSSPWVGCLLYGGNLHLDVTWATVLVGAIVRGHSRYSPVWSLCSCVG